MLDPRAVLFHLADALLLRVRRWNYRANYLKTRHWKETSAEAIERAGRRCNECGSPVHLETHHKTYAHLGDERPEDLEVLCSYCHAERHPSPTQKRR